MSEAEDARDDLFNASDQWPAHMSVSAVLFNDRHEVAMHHWEQIPWGDNVYNLMHETLHNLEPLEVAVARGLREEWGAEGKIIAYLGTQVLNFYITLDKRELHKALPYFLVELSSINPDRRDNSGVEAQSAIVWKSIPDALAIMADQSRRFPDRPDFDETVALTWARDYLHI
jgi:hypothetical protein